MFAMKRSTCVLFLGFVTYVRTDGASKMEGFIVGGRFASIENYPHSVFLSVNCVTDKKQKFGWICGASVLNQKILLTAGHCLFTCSHKSHIKVNVGSENRAQGQVHLVHSFVVHQEYSPRTSANDLALLRLTSEIMLNKKTRRVALMRKPPYNEPAKVAGWGNTDEINGRSSDLLKYVSQKVWDRKACLNMFKYVTKGTICAASKKKGNYAASGDSGSALVVRGYIQIGLVSYKVPSISKNVIIYTDIGYFFKWIRAYSKILNCIE